MASHLSLPFFSVSVSFCVSFCPVPSLQDTDSRLQEFPNAHQEDPQLKSNIISIPPFLGIPKKRAREELVIPLLSFLSYLFDRLYYHPSIYTTLLPHPHPPPPLFNESSLKIYPHPSIYIWHIPPRWTWISGVGFGGAEILLSGSVCLLSIFLFGLLLYPFPVSVPPTTYYFFFWCVFYKKYIELFAFPT